uniref:Uncharacterized protein n=1 Tax=Anguilla anguilla TaxID=7936 RepID=A0A0E9UUG5_ANGAN
MYICVRVLYIDTGLVYCPSRDLPNPQQKMFFVNTR